MATDCGARSLGLRPVRRLAGGGQVMRRSAAPDYEEKRQRAQRKALSARPRALSTPILKRLLKSGILNGFGRRQAYGELVLRRKRR